MTRRSIYMYGAQLPLRMLNSGLTAREIAEGVPTAARTRGGVGEPGLFRVHQPKRWTIRNPPCRKPAHLSATAISISPPLSSTIAYSPSPIRGNPRRTQCGGISISRVLPSPAEAPRVDAYVGCLAQPPLRRADAHREQGAVAAAADREGVGGDSGVRGRHIARRVALALLGAVVLADVVDADEVGRAGDSGG